MYIVKVKDELRPFAPVVSSRVLLYDLGRWGACLLRYKTVEEARAFIRKQQTAKRSRPSETIRDYRIFEQNGRKLRLIEEIKGE